MAENSEYIDDLENSGDSDVEEVPEVSKTQYSEIFGRFLNKIEDTELVKMESEYRHMLIKEWFLTAMGFIEMDKLRIVADLTDRDDEAEEFNAQLTNAEIEGIALYMVVAWYENKVNSLDHTLLFMGSKDEKWTSQRDHWKQTKEIQDSYRLRARKYFRNHSSRDNAYIFPEKY